MASAQHAAFPPAQLPAQLAAPLFQAAFQALVLLQGAEGNGFESVQRWAGSTPTLCGSMSWTLPTPSAAQRHSHPFLVVQVPDQLVTLVHQRHQLLQQELLSVLLCGRFLPV